MDELQIIDGLKMICQCRGIKKRVFIDHISKGLVSVEGLKQATGAGKGDCGGKRCSPRITELVQAMQRR